MPGLKERAKTLVELADGAAFLFAERPLPIDEKAAALLGAPTRKRSCAALTRRWRRSSATGTRRRGSGDSRIRRRQRPEARRGGATAAGRPDRKSTSPGVFDVLAVLGREESLARIADQID